MDISIPQLESILESFVNETNKQILAEKEQILNQWKEDLNTLSIALEIIQKSENIKLLLFATIKVKYNLHNNSQNLKENHFQTICTVCIERITLNRTSQCLPQNIVLILFDIISITTFYSPQLFEIISNSNQFSPDELICFFSYLLNEISTQSQKGLLSGPQKDLDNFINSNASKILELLQQSAGPNISISWISLHCILPSFNVSYATLTDFLPFIEIALTNEEYIPIILEYLDTAIGTNFSEEYPYLKGLIKIMINYAMSIFSDPTDEKVYQASFIWEKIIDENFEFFADPEVGPEFTNYVFENFIQSLPAFLLYDLKDDFKEFFNLLKTYSNCLAYRPKNLPTSYFTNYISSFLDFLINQIDYVTNLTMPREDRLSPNCLFLPELDECLMLLMLTDEENKKFYSDKNIQKRFFPDEDIFKRYTEFNQFLLNYFKMKIENITNGLIYIFSFVPKDTAKFLESRIGLKIIESQSIFVTSVYFISHYCQFIPEFEKQQINITFAISNFEYPPRFEVSRALAKLSDKYAISFIDDPNYILIIQKMIEISPINTNLSNLFISIFNILYQFDLKFSNSDQQEMIQTINDIFEKVHTLFATKIPFNAQLNDIMNLSQFNQIVIPIIKNSNNFNDMMTPYYARLFSHVEEVLTISTNQPPLLLNSDPEIQYEICQLVESALEKHWIINKEPYYHWIEQILNICPNSDHLHILSFLIEFLPTQPIIDFLSKLGNFSEDMINEYVKLLIEILKVNPPLLQNLVVPDQILFPMKIDNIKVFNNELNLLILFIKSSNISVDDADKIAQLVTQKTFSNISFQDVSVQKSYKILSIYYSIIFLKIIGSKFKILQNTLHYILEAIGIQNQYVEKFANFYMQDNPKNLEIGINELIKALIAKY